MKRRLAAALALALGWPLLAASPAHADTAPCAYASSYEDPNSTYDTPMEDSVCWPLQPNSTIVLQGPRYAWGIRTVARYLDARLERLTIISAVGARCSDYPGAYCGRVQKRWLSPAEQGYNGDQTARMGEFQPDDNRYDGTATGGTIRLNWAWRNMPLEGRQYVAGHELLHMLGMQHHVRDGHGPYNANGQGMLADSSFATLPSRTEIAYLRLWYEADCGPC